MLASLRDTNTTSLLQRSGGRRDGARSASDACAPRAAGPLGWRGTQAPALHLPAVGRQTGARAGMAGGRAGRAGGQGGAAHPASAPAAPSTSSCARLWMAAAEDLSFCGAGRQRASPAPVNSLLRTALMAGERSYPGCLQRRHCCSRRRTLILAAPTTCPFAHSSTHAHHLPTRHQEPHKREQARADGSAAGGPAGQGGAWAAGGAAGRRSGAHLNGGGARGAMRVATHPRVGVLHAEHGVVLQGEARARSCEPVRSGRCVCGLRGPIMHCAGSRERDPSTWPGQGWRDEAQRQAGRTSLQA